MQPIIEVKNLIFKFFKDKRLLSMKLYLNPNERIAKIPETANGIISACGKSEYPLSTMVSIFNVGFLRKILKPGETAWQFEKNAVTRMSCDELEYLAQLNFNLISVQNLMVRGKLVPWRNRSKLFHLSMNGLETTFYKIKIVLNLIRLLSLRDLFTYMIK